MKPIIFGMPELDSLCLRVSALAGNSMTTDQMDNITVDKNATGLWAFNKVKGEVYTTFSIGEGQASLNLLIQPRDAYACVITDILCRLGAISEELRDKAQKMYTNFYSRRSQAVTSIALAGMKDNLCFEFTDDQLRAMKDAAEAGGYALPGIKLAEEVAGPKATVKTKTRRNKSAKVSVKKSTKK